MEVLESGEQALLTWDRKLSELSDPGDSDVLLYNTHFTELLDEFSQNVLGQLLNDPFLSEKNELMEVELSPASPAPLIQAEHSYSLCGDSRPQSPLTHISTDDNFHEADLEGEEWCLAPELTPEAIKTEPTASCETPGLVPSVTLTVTAGPGPLGEEEPQLQSEAGIQSPSHKALPKIKLEPHEVDQFLNLSSKEAMDPLQLPPTPPSSHGSDSEGSQSPGRSLPPSSPVQTQSAAVKVTPRAASALSSSPLLTAPHKLQGSGPLILTEEEKRTLIAEGYPVPTKLPLTKAEEKALKKIRRKIKNKISAQESRRKKKEYMDSLEKKVECCSNENNELRKKVEVLESTNRTLLQQLQRLQAMVASKVSRSCKAASTQTGTCLMVVVLCFALIFGSFSQGSGPYPSATKMVLPSRHSTPESYTASVVRSRSLLIYEEHPPLEEPYRTASSVERGDVWERSRAPPLHGMSLPKAEGDEGDEVARFVLANQTGLEKSVLLELQQHLVSSKLEANETLKVIEIDRTVNATL
ncbi:cyclic AMP-responsive element-binding protein 3-like protein 2 isoform X1 [Ornithorhynchus anatinus]|uniref:Cyclic AMP-responsive element-binding protein 3-like protein 2 n=2 Tax=Ornithorhynchus anatinus TaxID=9258 RepID=A0A6I8PAV0_ORNAN|nr:cyclic AMP-responsive element-binding protein 3-like protein 2 isoform X1 [Ornithorhynchus anatinus]